MRKRFDGWTMAVESVLEDLGYALLIQGDRDRDVDVFSLVDQSDIRNLSSSWQIFIPVFTPNGYLALQPRLAFFIGDERVFVAVGSGSNLTLEGDLSQIDPRVLAVLRRPYPFLNGA